MEIINARALLSFTRRAVEQYEMIEEGDRIAVGLSGGKDSTALLLILNELKKFYPKKFDLFAVTVNTGFENMDFSPLVALCNALQIPYKIVDSNIAKVVFETRKEKNPCSLCARMRRGMLHDAVRSLGCNKIALGHHADDVLVTFLLNLFHEGRIGCFSPVTYLSIKQITMIRPFVYADEKSIIRFVSQNHLPVVKSTCPEDHHTEREVFQEKLERMEKESPGLKKRIFTAIQKGNVDGFSLK